MVLRGFIHVHSDVQGGQLSVPKLVELHKQRGYNFLCVTDHLQKLTAKRYRELVALCESLSEEGFICLYGLEGACRSGSHLLAIAPNEFVPLDRLDLKTGVKSIQEAGGLAILAHPTLEEMDLIRDVPLNGIEVWNGMRDGWGPNCRLIKKIEAMRIAGQPAFGYGGPDAHRASQLFKVETVLNAIERSAEAVLEDLRAGRFFLRRGPVTIQAASLRPTIIHYALHLSAQGYWSALRYGKRVINKLGIQVPQATLRAFDKTR